MSDKEIFEPRKHRVPFDREYATTYKSEVNWLTEHGIKYAFVKQVNTLTTYKYKKNSELYYSLAEFYKTLETKTVKDMED